MKPSRVIPLLALLGWACSSKQGPEEDQDTPLRDAQNIIVEVDAMPGATPSFELLDAGIEPWLIFQRNLVEIVPRSVVGLAYPRSQAEVGIIDAPAGRIFSEEDILTLAARHRDLEAGAEDAHFHILFLDGAGEHPDGKAVQIGDTRVIAVFGAVPPDAPDLERLLEQSALLHELGHAIGLVGLGIPDTTEHGDPASPGHCLETNCVMQRAVTLTTQLEQFLQDGVVPILFGPNCLADLEAYYE